MAPTKDLFIYVDESGNMDFTPKGSAWFCLSALSTFEPAYGLVDWHATKHAAISAGILLQELKASEDRQWIRDRLFAVIGTGAGTVQLDAVAIDKAKTDPSLRPPDAFYGDMVGRLLSYVIAGRRRSFDSLFVILDTIPVEKKRQAIIGGIKQSIKAVLPATPYQVLERDSRAEHMLQLVDYCGWAIYVARERSELRPRAAIASVIHSDIDIFRRDTLRYY